MKRTSLFFLFSFVVIVSGNALATPVDEGKAALEAGQYEIAVKAFSKGVEEGDLAASYYLAQMLEVGLGVNVDVSAAVRLYKKAAEGGHLRAVNKLALMHYRGEAGIHQDYQEAARLFRIAADKGDRNALFNLGKMTFEGAGVPKDVKLALAFYKKAAEQDHILALNTLGALYLAGASGEADKVRARRYFERSASFGNAVGLFEVARVILEEGTAAQNLINAHTYLNLASARSHPRAPQALQELTALMSPEEVLQAQAQARSFLPETHEGDQ
ncbi:tetratricopeptide repeat protein [Roseibium sediminis]|uniref:tetratricopeptide repeat protein n=1 Tax=Roseibium sediminis TaxID=1775174 RepID=UPI00123D9042|nr:tetratricopeptide repeat protein [Roseibium sediminis]